MKRFALIALICAFIMGATSSAFATDLVVKGGDIRIAANIGTNLDFAEDSSDDTLTAYQRMRAAFQFVANEHLRADLEVSFFDGHWGSADGAEGIGATPGVVTRKAYITFDVPGTQATVKAGYQGFAIPSAVGYTSALDDRVGGVVIGTPFTDAFGMNLAWFRIDDNDTKAGNYEAKNTADDDLIYLSLPIACDGWNLTPWGMYAFLGDNNDAVAVTEDASAFWLGTTAEVSMFDPIVVKADLMYGALKDDNDANETSGWLADLSIAYKMDMMTPEIFFGYGSGSDEDQATDGEGSVPVLSTDTYISTMLFDGSSISQGNLISTDTLFSAWTVGLKLKDISFMEGLSHTFIALYGEGTNDKDSGLSWTNGDFTEEDSFVEVSFNTKYQIYEQLAAIIELGYADVDIENTDTDAAYQAALGLKYSF